MKRRRQWLFGVLTALSLALCVTTTAAWIRSYWRSDEISLCRQHCWQVNSDYGEFSCSVLTRCQPLEEGGFDYRAYCLAALHPDRLKFSNHWEFLHSSGPATNGTYDLRFP
jgi:hypothetical protein